jgi:hypothetical protein
MKDIFKVGDKVYSCAFGWGIVRAIDYMERDGFPIWVRFENGWENELFTIDGKSNPVAEKTLSFTEYTLEGFSQERPEELPKKGQIVWVRKEFPSEWVIGHFYDKKGNEYRTYLSPSFQGWNNKGIEIRTTNPYEDEQD